MDAPGQNYVGEVPSDFHGWVRRPRVLAAPRPQSVLANPKSAILEKPPTDIPMHTPPRI